MRLTGKVPCVVVAPFRSLDYLDAPVTAAVALVTGVGFGFLMASYNMKAPTNTNNRPNASTC